MSNRILDMIPTIQSVALVENSLDLVRRKKKKRLVGNAIETIVGSSLIQEEAKYL